MLQIKLNSSFFVIVLIISLVFTSSCTSTDTGTLQPTSESSQEEMVDAAITDETSALEEPTENPEPDQPIVFEDPVLYQLLTSELGKDEIYPADLAEFTSFGLMADEFIFLATAGEEQKTVIHFNDDAFEYDGVRYEGFGTVKSLADLKYFPALDKLYITLQPEIDYQTVPAEIARQVRVMLIYQSQIEDISFVRDYENLIVLTLNTNRITDISPVEGNTKLLWLSLNWNNIVDLSPVASLTSLKSISAFGNQISDLTPLSGLTKLEEIEFYSNQIKDISPLKEIKSLKVVELVNNQIEDVSPLSEFESFESLWLTGNPITNIELLSHIANLEY